MTDEHTEYTYEVTVRVSSTTGKVTVNVASAEGERIATIKGAWEQRKLHASVGNAILGDVWAKEYGNDKSHYIETGR